MKNIVLTGGGTAGHVTPNIALIDELKKNGFNIFYIGGKDSIEEQLIKPLEIPYYSISTGKLRRYLSAKNFTDMFRVAKGVGDAAKIIKTLKPDLIFSKGGFVSVPVVLGGALNNVPIIIHESDITPGLANKISIPFSKKVCTTFPETINYLPKNKGILTGSPIRKEIFSGDKSEGLKLCNFTDNKPIILVMGGSLGSVKINQSVREIVPKIKDKFQVVHLCGKNNLDTSISTNEYVQFEYLNENLKHILAMCDIIISRAGSNSISEFLALQKPNLLIPLSQKASRGDQILNATSFSKQGFSLVLEEENLEGNILLDKINLLYDTKENYIENMKNHTNTNGIKKIIDTILELV